MSLFGNRAVRHAHPYTRQTHGLSRYLEVTGHVFEMSSNTGIVLHQPQPRQHGWAQPPDMAWVGEWVGVGSTESYF